MSNQLPRIEIGDQVFVGEGTEASGAVRQLGHGELTIDIEGAGDFRVPLAAVHAVHDGKVILDLHKLDPALRQAVGHAHDREDPNL